MIPSTIPPRPANKPAPQGQPGAAPGKGNADNPPTRPSGGAAQDTPKTIRDYVREAESQRDA